MYCSDLRGTSQNATWNVDIRRRVAVKWEVVVVFNVQFGEPLGWKAFWSGKYKNPHEVGRIFLFPFARSIFLSSEFWISWSLMKFEDSYHESFEDSYHVIFNYFFTNRIGQISTFPVFIFFLQLSWTKVVFLTVSIMTMWKFQFSPNLLIISPFLPQFPYYISQFLCKLVTLTLWINHNFHMVCIRPC